MLGERPARCHFTSGSPEMNEQREPRHTDGNVMSKEFPMTQTPSLLPAGMTAERAAFPAICMPRVPGRAIR